MGIADANNAGNVHGGLIMRLCDEVAGIAAVRHCGGRVVTAAMDRMTFNEPVYVGQLVTVKATVNAAWRTSMEVGVRVESENVRTGETPAHLDRLPDDGRPRRRRAARRRCRRSRRRRPTRRGGRARRSCAATTASPSGSGSRPTAQGTGADAPYAAPSSALTMSSAASNSWITTAVR